MTAPTDRLHALDAVRGFALTLGVFFHAAASFVPGPQMWIVMDDDRSLVMSTTFFVLHIFRMTLFFFIAGFFAHMAFHRRGLWSFVRDRAQRIALPLVVFWPLVMAGIIGAAYVAAAFVYGGEMPPPPPAPSNPPPLLFPLTHLWFLYVLLLLYVATLVLRGMVALVDRGGALRRFADRIVGTIMAFPLAPLLVAIPIGLTFFFDPTWLTFGIPTPDYSLIPNVCAAVGYGVAFGFGWVIHRQTELLKTMEQRWFVYLPIAIALSAVCVVVTGTTVPVDPPVISVGQKALMAACYAVAAWAWTFGLIGLALKFLSGASGWRRYLADASYWIYIVHLPLVMAGQAFIAKQPYAWWIKYPALVIAVMAIGLITYHLFVRRTFMGWMLNGKRAPKKAKTPATSLQAQPG